jgi:integrase/recombinase XerD
LRNHRRSPATVKAYGLTCRRFVVFLTTRQVVTAPGITREHLAEFFAAVAQPATRPPLAPNTLAMYDKSLRAFTAWLTRERRLLFDPAERLARIPAPPPSLPCVPSPAEVEALLAACPLETPVGLRTRTLLELLYGSALRLGEAVALLLADCDLDSGQLAIRSAKGGKDRLAPMSDGARLWLGRYLERARPLFVWKDRPTNALFLTSTTGRRLGILMARRSFHEARVKAGLTLPFVPHSLRHAAATHMLAAGCDLAYLRELLGHARLATTERYTAVTIGDLVEAHRRFHPAWLRAAGRSPAR